MSLTTDPNDPRLGHGIDKEPIPQHDVYLVLSEEERAKGFVRPVRNAYVHVGRRFDNIQKMTDEEIEKHKEECYIAKSFYSVPNTRYLEIIYMTQEDLDSVRGQYVGGCGSLTSMGAALSETYARDPSFYGATYCCHCMKHLPVNEFVWDGTNQRVGS